MTNSAPKVPWYKSQGFWLIALLMIGLRLGYKAWQREQRPSYETTMEKLKVRNQQFEEQLRAAEAANPTPVVIADTALLADTTAAPR
ncbi:MAG: hypothetical protein H7Z21_09525 [Hymenobacter sp.]|nr:hypothetical protein [Hymenobacter sp.]